MHFLMNSESSGKKYEVKKNDGKWGCQCPHWQYRLRKSGAACKHIESAKALMKEFEALESSKFSPFNMEIKVNARYKDEVG